MAGQDINPMTGQPYTVSTPGDLMDGVSEVTAGISEGEKALAGLGLDGGTVGGAKEKSGNLLEGIFGGGGKQSDGPSL